MLDVYFIVFKIHNLQDKLGNENAKELGNMADIDGFLVGGASLDAGKFSTIYHAFANAFKSL